MSKIEDLGKMGKVKFGDLTIEDKIDLFGIKEPSEEELEAIKNNILNTTSGLIEKAENATEIFKTSGFLNLK